MQPDTLAVERIANLRGLEEIRAEWLALWSRVHDATPFQSPGWLIPWWEVWGQGELLALALRGSSRLVGLVPLYVHGENGMRKLLPVGIGVSDYLDPLLEPELAVRGMAAVLQALEQERDRFVWADIEQQRPGSPWLTAPLPNGWSRTAHACTPAPVLSLSPATISAHRRNRLRYYRRRADAFGGAHVRMAAASEIDVCLGDLDRLHAARWRARGEPGVLADAAVQTFHRRAASELRAQGCLRLYLLEIGGQVAAVFHAMADSERCYVYACGFDPAFASVSPGKLVIGQIVDDAVAAGYHELHFLRGQEDYKYEWGATDQALHGVRLQLGPPR